MYPLQCIDGYNFPSRGGDDVYVLNISLLAAGLAAVSSDQQLSLFHPGQLKQGPVQRYRTDHGNVTSTCVFDANDSIICTAGENGSVSIWDFRAGPARAEVAKLTNNNVPVLSLGCSKSSYSVVAGTELQNSTASILIWDVRSTPTPRHEYKEVHSDDITELNFHPSDPNILLSGSTDGLVNVCDTRITDEDEVIIQTFNHGSVHHSAFLNDTELYALSHDEQFALYNMAEEVEKGVATRDFGDMRQVFECQYIANIFAKANGAGAVIGVGTHEQQLFELVHLSKSDTTWELDRANSVGLPGAHGSEIVRSFCFLDEEQLVFSAGEDGYVKAWRPNA